MGMFKLKERTFTVRDQEVTVRELTQAKRSQFTEAISAHRQRGPAMLASLGLVSPELTEEQAADEPAVVIEAIVEAVMKISNMGVKKAAAKERNA